MRKSPLGNNTSGPEDDRVGYGRPPKHTIWQPGRSGNPRGRPKGRRNIATIIREQAMQLITVTVGGRRRKMPRYAALLHQQWAEAFKSNAKAWAAIQQTVRDAGLLVGAPEPSDLIVTEDDAAIINHFLVNHKMEVHNEAAAPNAKKVGPIQEKKTKRKEP